MAELLAKANTTFAEWLGHQSDVDKPDQLLLYMAFLAGFQAGMSVGDDDDS